MQLVRCLLCKHEDPSLTPKAHINKSGMEMYASNPSAGEAEMGRPLEFSVPQPTWYLRVSIAATKHHDQKASKGI